MGTSQNTYADNNISIIVAVFLVMADLITLKFSLKICVVEVKQTFFKEPLGS